MCACACSLPASVLCRRAINQNNNAVPSLKPHRPRSTLARLRLAISRATSLGVRLVFDSLIELPDG